MGAPALTRNRPSAHRPSAHRPFAHRAASRPSARRAAWAAATAAAVMLLAACGRSGEVATSDDVEPPATTAVVTTTRPADGDTPAPSEEPDQGAIPGGIDLCGAVAPLAPSVIGDLGPMANIDEEVMGVAMTFAAENPDIFAGLWIDRDHGGALVIAVTEDADRYRAELAARGPSPDDVAVVDPRPPIADPSPLGERANLAFDVVEARFTEAELRAVQQDVFADGQPIATLFGGGVDTIRNRVSFDFIDPSDDDLLALAAMVPDPEMVCVNITRTVVADLDPLVVIPESIDDAALSCGGYGPQFAAGALSAGTPVADVDHPAAEAMLDVLADPPRNASLVDITAPMPRGDWVLLYIDGEMAAFAIDEGLEPGFITVALFTESASGWVFAGWDPTCDPEVALPEGANRVDVVFDSSFGEPAPTDTELHVLVTEQACNNGEAMGDRLRGPQVVESDTEVVIAFAAVSQAGFATCPGNPSTPVTIELDAPLGDRVVVDGLAYPRRAITTSADR